jgi:hypothetical protein
MGQVDISTQQHCFSSQLPCAELPIGPTCEVSSCLLCEKRH